MILQESYVDLLLKTHFEYSCSVKYLCGNLEKVLGFFD